MAGYIGTQAVSVNTTSATISDDLSVGDDLTVTDDATIGGTLGVTGVVTANAGVVVDEMTLDADTLTATDDFIIDAVGEIVLDSATGITQYKDGGTEFLRISESSGDAVIQSTVQDKKIFFSGDDNGGGVNALILDMADAGAATFNSSMHVGADVDLVQAKHIRFKHQAGGTIRASISAESDDKLQFSTGSSETARMTIDTNGNVGIGDVPTGNLTAGYALRLDGGAQTFLAFNNNPHTTQVTGGFVIGNDNGAARITQRESQHVLFEVGGSEVLTLEVNKNVTIEDGNLVIGTSGHGIDFSAGAAGASTSNLLDEYEEGTWTPVIPNTTTAVFDGLTAKYVKIGANVSIFLSGQINLPSTDVATISGLPFTSSGNYGVTPYAAGQAIAADRNSISFVTNGTTLLVRSIGQTGATAAFTATNLTDNAFYHVQFVYGTNS